MDGAQTVEKHEEIAESMRLTWYYHMLSVLFSNPSLHTMGMIHTPSRPPANASAFAKSAPPMHSLVTRLVLYPA